MVETDYLIVGQGLAGTWLHHFLEQAGKHCLVIDQFNPNSASQISSGIVNPITGRKLVKTWLFDTMHDFAKPAYLRLEEQFDIQVWHDRNIVWLLQSEQDLNNFSARSATEGYAHHIAAVERGNWRNGFQSAVGYAEVKGNYIDTTLLINAYRKYLQQTNQLREDFVKTDDLKLLPDGVQWKDVRAQKIIFCEGYLAAQNPFFTHLPHAPNKGEVLIIEAPELQLIGHLVKGGAFLVPLSDGLYWAGSQYNFDEIDENATVNGRLEIETALQRMLTVPYTVVNHWAGIRPSTMQRRPLVGIHRQFPQIGILNGLGTKGVLMSAYFAHLLSELLVHNQLLPKEIGLI